METPSPQDSAPEIAASPKTPRSQLAANIALLASSLFIVAAFSEIGLRVFSHGLAQVEDERTLTYRYDAQLGWFPIPNSSKRFTGSRTITISHNSNGFRDHEPVKDNRPGIVFLGDSLVWGFDVEAQERFTEKLQAKHPNWGIYNFGVSGYGTDQEYLLLQRYFDRYHPRVVFLVICGDNDNDDNAWNFRGDYYKPYYTLEGGGLRVKGIPVPKSENVFFAEHPLLSRLYLVRLATRVRCRWSNPRPVENPKPPTGALLLDMRGYVAKNGAFFAVGLQHSNDELENFLKKFNIPFVDLTTTNAAHCYPTHGNHWTPEGHSFVADKINAFLEERERK